MEKIQHSTVVALGLVLGGGMILPVGAQTLIDGPLRPIFGGGMMQVTEAPRAWAIRPADKATELTQMSDVDADIEARAPAPDERSMEISSDDGIRHVSGGVGESERTELNTLANDFNLHLMFATKDSGEYLSAVRVKILDASNSPVLSAVSKGPWFYAQVPPGKYSVEVTPSGSRGEDETQREAVQIDRSNQSKLDFYWAK